METPNSIELLLNQIKAKKEQEEKVKKAELAVQEKALANGPCRKQFNEGENSLPEWILSGVYQETPDVNAVEILQKELATFLRNKSNLKPFLLISALWINFWDIIAPSFKNTLTKSLNIISIIENNWFSEGSIGEYKGNIVYFIAKKNAALIHELKHAIDNFIYLNDSLPFFESDENSKQEWETIAKEIMNDNAEKLSYFFDYQDYPEEEQTSEFSARIMTMEFLKMTFSQSKYVQFAKKYLQQFCEDATANINIIIKRMGLNLLPAFIEEDLFKDGKIYLDQISYELLNAAQQQKKTITALLIEKKLADQEIPEEIFEWLIKNNLNLDDIYYAATQVDSSFTNFSQYISKQFIYSDHFIAVKQGNIEFLQNSIGKYADINTQDEDGYTLLHHAASANQPEIIRWLIKKDIDVNALQGSNTALILAVKKNHKEAVTMLLNICAEKKIKLELNTKDDDERTALHLAVVKGYNEIAQVLLKQQINVNLQAYVNKYTPLHIACMQNNASLVKVLLDRTDIDISLRDSDEKTALDYALQENNEEIINLFKSYQTKKHLFSQSPLNFFNSTAANEKIEDAVKNNAKQSFLFQSH